MIFRCWCILDKNRDFSHCARCRLLVLERCWCNREQRKFHKYEHHDFDRLLGTLRLLCNLLQNKDLSHRVLCKLRVIERWCYICRQRIFRSHHVWSRHLVLQPCWCNLEQSRDVSHRAWCRLLVLGCWWCIRRQRTLRSHRIWSRHLVLLQRCCCNLKQSQSRYLSLSAKCTIPVRDRCNLEGRGHLRPSIARRGRACRIFW